MKEEILKILLEARRINADPKDIVELINNKVQASQRELLEKIQNYKCNLEHGPNESVCVALFPSDFEYLKSQLDTGKETDE